MTDTDQNAVPTVAAPSELDVLKARAKQLGIKHHPMIGLDKLKIKVNAAMSDTPPPPPETLTPQYIPRETAAPVKMPETKIQLHTRLRKEAEALQRVVVTCLNPNKKEWEGEIFTVGNSAVGSIKKYVPFNNDEGWHVPTMIVNMIKERKCQIFVNGKNSKGQKGKQPKSINEFAITYLDPLTKVELKELATKQALNHSIDANI